MPDYKRQHYLPVVYLREFAIDDSLPRPKLRIWRYDGEQSKDVSVEGQCSGNYFYSKEYAAPVEKMFGNIERFYAETLANIRKDQKLSESDMYGLILAMADFHARNAAYVNETGQENRHAYQLQASAFQGAFVGKLKGTISEDELLHHLTVRWRAQLLTCDYVNNPLISSDNPVVLFASGNTRPRLSLMVLPLSPDCLAVAFDHRIHRVRREVLSSDDVGELYHLQARCSLRSVYSHTRLHPQHEAAISSIIADNPNRHRGFTTAGGVKLPMLKLPDYRKLSFVGPSALRL